MEKDDFIEKIKKYHEGRDLERLAIKYGLLRTSPSVFFRGTCHLYYDELDYGAIPDSPPAWICADLHMENFGTYKSDGRSICFDINDFDEGLLAPALWEVLRFLTGVQLSPSILKISGEDADALCLKFSRAYQKTLAGGKAFRIERKTAKGEIRDLMDCVKKRKRKDFLDKRAPLQNKERKLLIDGKRAFPASEEERDALLDLMENFSKTWENPAWFKVLDSARRIAGNGSLGIPRYIILTEGKGSPHKNYLFDLKLSLPSCALPYVKIKQPEWASESERILFIQKLMQADSPAFLNSVNFNGRPFILKELQPSEDKLSLKHLQGKFKKVKRTVQTMGMLTASSQLRGAGVRGASDRNALMELGASQEWGKNLIEIARKNAQKIIRQWEIFSEYKH